MKTCLLLGAAGLVGGHLLELLRADPGYSRVTVWVRRPLGLSDPKVEERIVDMSLESTWQGPIVVDDVFCCLGTTIKVAGSQEAFRRVDLEYPLRAGRQALAGGAKQYLLCSAVGADPKSRIFYNRVKGECEEGLAKLGFPGGLKVFHPSLLLGARKEKRAGEGLATALMGPTAFLLTGPLRRYRPIPAATVARAMNEAAKRPEPGVCVYEGTQLFAMGKMP
jgi:uncharacterized protein YbjT (DUF2867 family)